MVFDYFYYGDFLSVTGAMGLKEKNCYLKLHVNIRATMHGLFGANCSS